VTGADKRCWRGPPSALPSFLDAVVARSCHRFYANASSLITPIVTLRRIHVMPDVQGDVCGRHSDWNRNLQLVRRFNIHWPGRCRRTCEALVRGRISCVCWECACETII
jgi:hypothetical protein